MNIQTVLERRSNFIAEMRSLTDKASGEDRDLSDDENTQFEELRGKLSATDKQLERAEVISAAERSMQADPNQPRRGNDGSFEEACRNFSVTKAMAVQFAPGEVDAAREIEISQELAVRSGRKPSGIYIPHEVFEERALLTSGSGGNLVPTQHRDDLTIDRLSASLQVAALGATILPGLIGNQDIPRLTGGATTFWVAEHGAVTPSDQTFDTEPGLL